MREIRARRQRLKAQYPSPYPALVDLFARHDPIRLVFMGLPADGFEPENADEYEPEVGTILPRLMNIHSVEDICRIVHEEFIKWFGEQIAGPETRYRAIAQDMASLLATHPESPHRQRPAG